MTSDLLHRLWRRVPHPLRRAVFDSASRLAAPAAGQPPQLLQNPTISVLGAMKAPTGLGEAARLTALGFQRAGFQTRICDVTEMLRQPQIVEPPDLPAISEGPGILFVFGNPPVTSYALARVGRRLLQDKVRVGCWVWEFDRLPERWNHHASLFHLLAAPNAFVAAAIRASVPDQTVVQLPYPLDPAQIRPPSADRAHPKRFRIGFIFDVGNDTGRKNPEAVIEATALAFPEDPNVEVVVTVSNANRTHPKLQALSELARSRGVSLTLDIESRSKAHHLDRFAGFDVYVSLHRAEGFGLTVAEAVLAGVPVIATRAAPVTEYLREETSFLVAAKAQIAPGLIDSASPGVWHEADAADAASRLHWIRTHPIEARSRAEQAQHHLMALYGPQAFMLSTQALIGEIGTLTKPGQR